MEADSSLCGAGGSPVCSIKIRPRAGRPCHVMPELRTYRRHEMPRDLAWQVRSYTRIQWPFLDVTGSDWWDFTPREDNPVHFVIADGDLLISHASVNWRNVRHSGQTYNVFGLSTVFTYPAYRKCGHAQRVV